MKAASADLIALLLTGSFVSTDLYTLDLSDGSTLRYTTADVDIRVTIDIFDEDDIFALADIFGYTTWTSSGPFMDDPDERAVGHWKTGLDVDTWQVRVTPRAIDPLTDEEFPDKIGALGWLAAAAGGALDGAVVTVERAYLAAWPTPWIRRVPILSSGSITIFAGRMAEVDVGRSFAVLNVNDFRELLDIAMPRNLYQSGCRFTLFDTGCTLSAAAFVVAGTVVDINANGNEITANLTDATGYYDLGRLVMTSGDNTGFGRQVRSWTLATHVIKIIAPFFFDVAIGDTFNIYPGCNKTLTICTNTFANAVNYGGFPDIPAPETAV